MASMTLDDLVAQLRKAYGEALEAVVLYGSAAAGEHIAKRSDYNVLVIVSALPMQQLRAASAVARAWADAGNPAPLTLTSAEWRTSADIFPMEYADILERHRVLYGTLPTEGLQPTRDHLRLAVEQQAMGKVLQLRQGILAAGPDGKAQLQLLAASLSTMMVIFRGAARLHGDRPSPDYEALSRAVAATAGFDPEPFARVIRHVRSTEKLSPADASAVLAGYLTGMEQLAAHLDRFDQP